MTDQRPAQVLQRYFASFSEGGLEAAAALWDPDIEWRSLEADAEGAVRGRDAMRRYYAEWVDTMDELGGEIGEIAFEDDKRAVVQIRNFGRGRVSGVPVSGSYYIAFLVRDGRIVIGHECATRDEALSAAEALGKSDA